MGGGATAACRQALKAKRRRLLRAEAEDVMLISRMVFCGLLMLFAVSAARADETISRSGSRGEYLARAGDCVACHSVAGGKAFAGGLKMGTPLGAIYSTNITPDPETGIGSYSLEDFDRAVRLWDRQGRPPALSGDAVSVVRQTLG